jgi:uncharacterized protein (DUF3820 family)
MPFGKHKGTLIKDLPRDYTEWLVRNLDDRNAELRTLLTTLAPAIQNDGQSRPRGSATPDTPMPFGKHKGTPIRDLPRDYAEWLVSNLGDGKEDIKAALRAAHEL